MALNMIDTNEQFTMEELLFNMKQKCDDLDITRQHLGRVIKANNRTRKRTRHQHYPKECIKQLTDKNKEMEAFYNEVHKYQLDTYELHSIMKFISIQLIRLFIWTKPVLVLI